MYIGLLGAGSSIYSDISFLEEADLFGLSIGIIMIGVSFFIAEKPFTILKDANAYTGGPGLISWTEINHNIFTLTILVLGVLSAVYFGSQILKTLIIK